MLKPGDKVLILRRDDNYCKQAKVHSIWPWPIGKVVVVRFDNGRMGIYGEWHLKKVI